ncbi:hypothetical protein [Aeromicrobium sp. UC242_57]|uniref:hypothetical protein n=1 Tax=Aeromicrobium sp. UC242_57 TaxID=3374624 RepID=UPI00378F06FB
MRAFNAHGPLPDGSQSVESAIAMINGLFGYGGPSQMLHGAERAVTLETDRSSPFYALAQVTLGHADVSSATSIARYRRCRTSPQ